VVLRLVRPEMIDRLRVGRHERISRKRLSG
jgi:hypothetical protein